MNFWTQHSFPHLLECRTYFKHSVNMLILLTLLSGVQVVSFGDWVKIDQAETCAGETVGKPREKLTSVTTMLDIAAQR